MPRAARRPSPIVRRKKREAIVRREPVSLAEAVEKVLIGGDLAPLTVEQRLDYYKKVCQSLGLNPMTRPFDYISYNGKLTLYARRDCTDQLRKIYGVSVTSMKKETSEGLYMVEVEVKDRNGRTDVGTGVIFTSGLKGLDLANAIMKAETKAKRRATLSVCGLGFLDQSEMDSLPEYNEVTPGGRLIVEQKPDPAQEVALRKLAENAGGKPIEDYPAEAAAEKYTITVTPYEEGRVSLAGKEGLAVVRSELSPELIAELDIKYKAKSKITHMPTGNFFKFKDRAEKCGVIVTLGEVSLPQRSAEEAAGEGKPQGQASAPAQGSLI